MKQPEENLDSWISLVWLGVCVYWVLYFLLEFIGMVPEYGLAYFVLGTIVLVLLFKWGKKWMFRKWLGIFPESMEAKSVESLESPDTSLPFFVRGQLRRRKLDLTRKSNFISDSVSTKTKRQRQGIFGIKKKKKRS